MVYQVREEYGLNIRSTCSAIRVVALFYYYDTYVNKGDALIAEVQKDFDH